MAEKITAAGGYWEDFAGGQGLPPPYTQYAPHMDDNFAILKAVINTLVDESRAVLGPNALLSLRMFQQDNPAGQELHGRVGRHSLNCALVGAPDTFRLDAGDYIVGGLMFTLASQTDFVASGAAGSRYLAADAAGNITLETAASQQVVDLWSATWNGTILSNLTAECPIYPDGDDLQDCLSVVGNATCGPPNETHELIANRFENLERLLRGMTTNISGGTALGPLALQPGSAASPALRLSDGAESFEASGLYRAAANVLGIAYNGVAHTRIESTGIRQEFSAADATPRVFRSTGTTTGLGYPAAGGVELVVSGNAAIRADQYGFGDLPTNPRVRGRVTAAQSVANSTIVNIDFDGTDDYEVPGSNAWHNEGSGTLSDREEFTVPTGADGGYRLAANCEFADNATGSRMLRITQNGTAIAEIRVDAVSDSEPTFLSCSTTVAASAADVFRCQVEQKSGGALNLSTASFSIEKVW